MSPVISGTLSHFRLFIFFEISLMSQLFSHFCHIFSFSTFLIPLQNVLAKLVMLRDVTVYEIGSATIDFITLS